MEKTISILIKISSLLINGASFLFTVVAKIFYWLAAPFLFLELKTKKMVVQVKSLDPNNPTNIQNRKLKERRKEIKRILSNPPKDPNKHPKIPFHRFKAEKPSRTSISVPTYITTAEGELAPSYDELHEGETFEYSRPGILTRVVPGQLDENNND